MSSNQANYAPLTAIEPLKGNNYGKWKEQLLLALGIGDLDYALRVDEPPAPGEGSSPEVKEMYNRWERCNRLSLMVNKNSIVPEIRGMTNLFTLKYNASEGVRRHILKMSDMAAQLKTMDMPISEGYLVHVILRSLPSRFDPFKINYNASKDKWTLNELMNMCEQEEERLSETGEHI
ncbi:hypothetical protein M569_16079 [Genlisea aurea]|uniref:Retrotransposon Copia-like N-terminal domain-containing protein n=1 Tax=Genlisea aurea TaxID=192259 RepID=S8BWI7_9LAMI|nr:hypothetical protein M569_16079 [Genlisea aurea]